MMPQLYLSVTTLPYLQVPKKENFSSVYFVCCLLSKNAHKGNQTSPGGMAQWIECRFVNQGVTGSIPTQGTCLSFRPDPQ